MYMYIQKKLKAKRKNYISNNIRIINCFNPIHFHVVQFQIVKFSNNKMAKVFICCNFFHTIYGALQFKVNIGMQVYITA